MAAARQGANPFNLAKKKAGGLPPKEYKAKTWTEEDKIKALEEYMEIPEEFWPCIRYSTHMRYITKAGEFRPGGFVTKNPLDFVPQGATEPKRCIKMQNNFNAKGAGHVEWMAAYEDIAHIYVKADAAVRATHKMLETVTVGLNKNIKDLALYAKKLDARVAALEGGE